MGLACACVLAAAAQAGESVSTTGPVAAKIGPLDLGSVVELALKQNPSLLAVAQLRQEVEQAVVEAKADAFPQFDVVSSWSQSRSPALLNSPDFEEIIQQFPGFEPAVQELYTLSLELSQSVYTGGKVAAAIDGAKLAVSIADEQIETARLDTALAAAEAYYRLLAAERALQTVEIQERARRESLDVVEARYEIGEATELERLRALAALEQVRPQVARLRGAVEVAKAALRAVLGEDVEGPIEVEPVEEDPPLAPRLEPLFVAGFESRPELADLRLQDDLFDRRRVLLRADGKPQVEITGAYGRQVRLPDNLSDPLFDDWRVALGVRWSVFDGGRRRGQIGQLESQRQQLGWQLEDLQRQVALEIEQTHTGYETAVASWTAARASAAAAREASRVAGENYREGVALQADLLDAQDQEQRAELVEIEAYYEAWIQAARLQRAVGRLPTDAWGKLGAPSS